MTVKSRILEILERKKGQVLSGEALAEELGCTRAAVWKAVKSLREEGYPIEAGSNRGYTLCPGSNLLSQEAIRLHLKNKTGSVWVCREVSSTNQEAKRAALEENAPAGSLVVANSQSAGRGRRGRYFYSPEKSGLYMSVILRPEGKISDSLVLTTSAAVAVYRAVEKICGISLEIKWVNDLYFQGKKVCGILTEAVTDFESGDIEFAVVGIGLNLYVEKETLPKELLGIVGGLYSGKEEAGKVDKNLLIGEIVNCLMEEAERNEISEIYIERNFIPGNKILICEENKIREAYAEKICSDGRLLIQEKSGEKRALSYGEVSLKMQEK